CATSKPSRFSASPNRRAKNTLPSMTRILGDGSAASVLMQPPPTASICRISHCTCFGNASNLEYPLFYSAVNVFERQHLIHRPGLDRFRGHSENDGTSLILSDYVTASFLYGPHAARSIIAHAGQDHGDRHGARMRRRA